MLHDPSFYQQPYIPEKLLHAGDNGRRGLIFVVGSKAQGPSADVEASETRRTYTSSREGKGQARTYKPFLDRFRQGDAHLRPPSKVGVIYRAMALMQSKKEREQTAPGKGKLSLLHGSAAYIQLRITHVVGTWMSRECCNGR